MYLIICLGIIIIIIIFLIFQLLRIYTYEKFENNEIHPMIQIAKETDYLEIIKKEVDELKLLKIKLNEEIKTLQKELEQLNIIIKNKENEKIDLEGNISNINNNIDKSLKTIKDSLDKTIEKEKEIKLKEEEINKDKDDKINEIFNKLQQILINKNNEFCKITNKIPNIKFKTYEENEKDLSYEWCNCNEDNMKSNECNDYINCKNNYDKYKDSKSLNGDELVTYFNCLKLYPEFPPYLKDNNLK